jgi:hypothetical protein
MKNMIYSLLVLIVSSSAAFACDGEAQLKAPIQSLQMLSSGSCLAKIDAAQTQFYASSEVCPLDLMDIQNEGVELKWTSPSQCQLGKIQEVNGLVYRDSSGHLVLE